MAREVTLRQLAEEAGLGLDEALVTVWDHGHEAIEDIEDVVRARDVAAVRRALGLANFKELRTLAFWERRWQLDAEATRKKLADDFGIIVGSTARTLPKGGIRRIRRQLGEELRVEPAEAPGQAKEVVPAVKLEPLVWATPGRVRDVVPLTYEEICQIHETLVRDFAASGDPIDPPGVRDPHLLHSATARPETSIGEYRKYDTVESYSAALLHSLVHNHPFHNGNKRTALVSTLVLLDRNNILLTCTERQLFRQVLRVSQHRLVPTWADDRPDREVLSIAEWICANSRSIQKGERVLKWKELRRVLTHLGCDVGPSLPGNKIKIERVVRERGVLGRKVSRTLRVTAGHRNEGSEVDGAQLNYIRRELHFDERHGYDSGYFYGTDPREPDEFIAEYRSVLRRLARL